MRNLVIGLAMASTALTAPAMAREGQWYIEGDAGVMHVEDIEFSVDDVGNAATADHSRGTDFGGIVGYDFGAFRLEAETAYKDADLDTVTATAVPLLAGFDDGFVNETRGASGDVSSLSFMLNGLFDFGPDDGLQAFGGGGIGIARTDFEGRVFQNGPGVWNDSDTGLAWQLLA